MSLLALLLFVSKSDIVDSLVSDTQAAAHVGEVVTLECDVINVRHARSGMEFVDCGERDTSRLVSLVVFADDVQAVGDLDLLKGRRVFAHGKLEVYKGKSQIVLHSSSQIRGRHLALRPGRSTSRLQHHAAS